MREGWVETTLGAVASLSRGFSYSAENLEGGDLLIGMKAFQVGGGFRSDGVKPFSGAAKEAHLVRPGDVVIANTDLTRDAGILGVPALIPDLGERTLVASHHVTILRPESSLISHAFLFNLLLSSAARRWMAAHATGTTVRGISSGAVERFTYLLPPISEQNRIVDLMRAVDEYITAADKHVETAKTARGALLADLLSNPGDDWAQVPLDHVAELKLGKMLSKERAAGPEQWPYLRNSNVQDGRLDLSDLKTMTFSHQDRATYSLVSGDILVCEGGDPGRSVLLKEDLKGICFQKALHRVRATGVSPEFLALEIRQAYCDRRISDLCTNTTISHLTAEKFGRMRIAVPPVAEQHRIVDLMRVVDDEVTTATKVAESARNARAALLSDLLSGNHEIPASYDRFLEAA